MTLKLLFLTIEYIFQTIIIFLKYCSYSKCFSKLSTNLYMVTWQNGKFIPLRRGLLCDLWLANEFVHFHYGWIYYIMLIINIYYDTYFFFVPSEGIYLWRFCYHFLTTLDEIRFAGFPICENRFKLSDIVDFKKYFHKCFILFLAPARGFYPVIDVVV